MHNERHNLDPIEALLRESDEAESAGVFNQTTVSHESLRTAANVCPESSPTLPAWVVQLRRRWVPIAAMLALAVTAWSVLFSLELSRLRDERSVTSLVEATNAPSLGDQFAVACLSGPGGFVDERCLSNDLDTDLEVTLADYGVLQRTVGHRAN